MNPAWVGAFVLLLGAVLVAGVLWLASGGAMHKVYDLYLAIENESVAGLNLNAPVKYNGVEVGKVRQIALDPHNPERVRLVFAIERGTPVKVDTVAALKTQGLTGIAYVELSGGTPDSALLHTGVPGKMPEIRTKPSLSARLENVLTDVLAKLENTSANINALLSDTNRKALTSALADMAAVARTVAARNRSIDAGIVSAARTLDNSARLTAQLGPVVDQVGRSADALQAMGRQAAQASTLAGKAVADAGADVKQFTAETQPQLQHLLVELGDLSATLRRLSEQTERNPASLLVGRGKPLPGPGETLRDRAGP